MSDEDILEHGGTEYDIAMYAHDVGNACMYPDYPCEICEARERFKAKERSGHDEDINVTNIPTQMSERKEEE